MPVEHRLRQSARAALVLAVAAGVGPPRVAAHEPPLPAPPVSWQELHFKASKLLLSATTALRVDVLPAPTVAPALRRAPGGGQVPASTPEVAVITVETDLPFGRGEVNTTWLDPVTGAVFQTRKMALGRRSYEKIRRYTASGYHAWRASPADDREERVGPDGWSHHRESALGGVAIPPGGVVTDSYALLYLLSAARLDREGARLRVYIYSDERLVQLDFEAREASRRSVDVEEVWETGRRRRSADIDVRRVVTTARPVDGRGGELDLGVFGMRSRLEILLERGTALPVLVSGDADYFGHIEVVLRKTVLTVPPGGTQ